ncbi:MAG: hypothetical protein LBM67_05810 [Lentimicrobiaceae bacterium]|jgi:hypothetical protein|nr:hypothetical protein [Lentimicrobiaceae bacterium]
MLKVIIADSRMPEKAKITLESLGNVYWLEPQDFVYESIAAHPDIFFFQHKNGLIVAPNTPEKWIRDLKKQGVCIEKGIKPLGKHYPETVFYNAVASGNKLIHNIKLTDETILNHFKKPNRIAVKQAYTRCNLIALNATNYITSDRNIQKKLEQQGFDVFFINPQQIVLPHHEYGFFPGCCGFFDHTLFVCGNIEQLAEKEAFEIFLKKNDCQYINLYDGVLTDVGSVFFVL